MRCLALGIAFARTSRFRRNNAKVRPIATLSSQTRACFAPVPGTGHVRTGQGIDETKYAMVTDMAAGFEENERELGRKRRGVLAVLTLAGVETALVGIAVIWSLWA